MRELGTLFGLFPGTNNLESGTMYHPRPTYHRFKLTDSTASVRREEGEVVSLCAQAVAMLAMFVGLALTAVAVVGGIQVIVP